MISGQMWKFYGVVRFNNLARVLTTWPGFHTRSPKRFRDHVRLRNSCMVCFTFTADNTEMKRKNFCVRSLFARPKQIKFGYFSGLF